MAENVFEKIGQEYYGLTAAERKTADFVIANQERCQYLSIAELAELSGVAEATVSRFCRRLGYQSFHAFKLSIASAAGSSSEEELVSGPIESTDSIAQMSQKRYYANLMAMHQTLELIKPDQISAAARLLQEARRVVCMGQGGSMALAEDACHLFSTVSGKFSAVADSHTQLITAVNLTPGDVLLYFSYSGATIDMMDTMKAAAERGAGRILITRFAKSPGAALADIVLTCGSNESPLQPGSVPAKIAQLYLLDVLLAEFCRLDPQASRESRERIASAMEVKHL